MAAKRQYNGLDAVKFILAIFVAMRHIVQIFFTAESRAHLLIGTWLSNLAVPAFFVISGFFLFRKVDADRPDRSVIAGYCKRTLFLYLVWSVIYLPIDWYNWANGESSLRDGVLTYLHSFVFSSSIVQLWYLPALALAAFLVWLCYTHGWKIWQILVLTGVLLLVGWVGDNWYLNEMLPHRVYQMLMTYNKYFLTMRNGIFYGAFYLALGLMFAKTTWRMPSWAALAGTAVSVGCMYAEVKRCSNTNIVLCAVPAVYCLFTAASAACWKDRPVYRRLREMSEWIYLAHFYFFYFFVWTLKWNPIPADNKSVTVMVLGAVILFAWGMTRLSERRHFRWIRRLI